MADEQYHWLDPDTAERLLRGEPLDTVDETVRDQAERLAAALYALAAEPQAEPPSADDAELPGEAAALAAFRKARAERADAEVVRVDRVDAHAHPSADAGRFRRVGPRGRIARTYGRSWGRPLRLAVSAALAAGAVGGVAVATTGVFPTPFGGEPAPAASVSGRATPGGPSASSSPNGSPGGRSGDARGGGPGASTPGGVPSRPSGADGGNDDRDGYGSPGAGAAGRGAGADGRWGRLAADCRDLRDGKGLDADRRHALEGAAGGSSRVWTYCKGVLKTADDRGSAQGGGRDDSDGDGNGGKDSSGGKGGKDSKGGKEGKDGKGGKGGTDSGGGKDGRGGKGAQGGDEDGGHISGGEPGVDAAGFAPPRPPHPAGKAPKATPAGRAAFDQPASSAAPASPEVPAARR